MTKKEFETKVRSIIQTLPEETQPKLLALAQETIDRHAQICESCNELRTSAKALADAEADFSVAVKYLLYDIECVRREIQGKGRDHKSLGE